MRTRRHCFYPIQPFTQKDMQQMRKRNVKMMSQTHNFRYILTSFCRHFDIVTASIWLDIQQYLGLLHIHCLLFPPMPAFPILPCDSRSKRSRDSMVYSPLVANRTSGLINNQPVTILRAKRVVRPSVE